MKQGLGQGAGQEVGSPWGRSPQAAAHLRCPGLTGHELRDPRQAPHFPSVLCSRGRGDHRRTYRAEVSWSVSGVKASGPHGQTLGTRLPSARPTEAWGPGAGSAPLCPALPAALAGPEQRPLLVASAPSPALAEVPGPAASPQPRTPRAAFPGFLTRIPPPPTTPRPSLCAQWLGRHMWAPAPTHAGKETPLSPLGISSCSLCRAP